MSLVNLPPAQPVLTLAQKQAQKLSRIKSRNTQLLQAIVSTVQANMNEVWSDPDQDNFSAQKVFDLLGTDGAASVIAANALISIANSQLPDSHKLPTSAPKPLTLNPDGSVLVGA